MKHIKLYESWSEEDYKEDDDYRNNYEEDDEDDYEDDDDDDDDDERASLRDPITGEDWEDDDDAFRGTSDKSWDYMYKKITTNQNMSAVQKWLDLLDFADPAPTPKKLQQRMLKIKNWLYRLSPEEKGEISAERERIKARELEGKEDYYDEDYF